MNLDAYFGSLKTINNLTTVKKILPLIHAERYPFLFKCTYMWDE